MRIFNRARFSLVIFMMVPAMAVLAVACATASPEEVEIPVNLEGDKLVPETIQVRQGDTVTLKIESNEPGDFHLHGYDIEKAVGASGATDLVFVADATGRFRITFHGQGEEHGSHQSQHGEILQSEVLYPGDTFSFQVPADLDGQSIPYHSHLHPPVAGSIIVSHDAPDKVQIEVEIKDMAVHPAAISVRPGTTIVWTNNSTEMQALASGIHPDATTEEHGASSHESESPEGADHESEDHHDGEGEEEIDVGFLEVRPR